MSVATRESWQRDTVHFPEPLPPLAHCYNLEPAAIGTHIGFEAWSLPLDRLRLEAFDGYVYLRMEPFGGEPPAPLAALMKRLPALAHLWRLDPAARRRIKGFDGSSPRAGSRRASTLRVFLRARPVLRDVRAAAGAAARPRG